MAVVYFARLSAAVAAAAAEVFPRAAVAAAPAAVPSPLAVQRLHCQAVAFHVSTVRRIVHAKRRTAACTSATVANRRAAVPCIPDRHTDWVLRLLPPLLSAVRNWERPAVRRPSYMTARCSHCRWQCLAKDLTSPLTS